MDKYGYEFKKQVVEAYLHGEGGYRSLSEKYGMHPQGIFANGLLTIRPLVMVD